MTVDATVTAETLGAHEVFASLEQAELAHLADHCTAMSFARYERVLRRDETSTDVYFVIRGRVTFVYCTEDGRSIYTSRASESVMFGELSALNEEVQAVDVYATEESLLARMPASDFIAVLEKHPGVAKQVMVRLAKSVWRLAVREPRHSLVPLPQRVCLELLHRASDNGSDGMLLVNDIPDWKALATALGSHREAVFHTFHRLIKGGIIERRGRGSYRIPDLGALWRVAEGIDPLQRFPPQGDSKDGK